MSLLRKILRVEPRKPTTQADLDQLELKARKEEIKARISDAKGKQWKAKSDKISSIGKAIHSFGSSNDIFPSGSKSRRNEMKWF